MRTWMMPPASDWLNGIAESLGKILPACIKLFVAKAAAAVHDTVAIGHAGMAEDRCRTTSTTDHDGAGLQGWNWGQPQDSNQDVR